MGKLAPGGEAASNGRAAAGSNNSDFAGWLANWLTELLAIDDRAGRAANGLLQATRWHGIGVRGGCVGWCGGLSALTAELTSYLPDLTERASKRTRQRSLPKQPTQRKHIPARSAGRSARQTSRRATETCKTRTSNLRDCRMTPGHRPVPPGSAPWCSGDLTGSVTVGARLFTDCDFTS